MTGQAWSTDGDPIIDYATYGFCGKSTFLVYSVDADGTEVEVWKGAKVFSPQFGEGILRAFDFTFPTEDYDDISEHHRCWVVCKDAYGLDYFDMYYTWQWNLRVCLVVGE